MEAYATAERVPQIPELRVLHPVPQQPSADAATRFNGLVVDELLGNLADLIADRVLRRIAADREQRDGWLDTRAAADYLGVHRDTIRRLAAEGVIPAQQAGVGCKLYFRRDHLEDWRRTNRSSVAQIARLGGRSR
jgi:excisionase family DNA binding protein